MFKALTTLVVILAVCCLAGRSIEAQTTAFTFQGSLKNGGDPAAGNYDFEFALFDSLAGGSQVGSTLTRNAVAVVNGAFTVSLDFGSQFPGASRFLEIRVRQTGQPTVTTLSPRQAVNSAPYSVKSLNTDTATNALQLGGVAASQYVVTTDPRMSNERAPSAGSGNYIQNQNSGPQSSSNFNISGTGTANIVNAATQFNLNGTRILSAPSNNVFVGPQAGQANTSGDSNSFFGRLAGSNNTSGGNNSFFGYLAGNNTNTGNGNAFFGYSAGRSNTTGGVNSFFGFGAGEFSTTANFNSFFGFNAGNKTTAEGNSFFGASAGQNNTTGTFNSFIGNDAGLSNTTGSSHVFVGVNAGRSNTTGGSNTFVGKDAGFANTTGSENAFFGAAAGQSNTTGGSNTFVGVLAGLLNTTGADNSFMGRAAGNANSAGAQNSFFGSNAGAANTTGNFNSFYGTSSGQANTAGGANSFFGRGTGVNNSTGSENSFFGESAGFVNAIGTRNSFFGRDAGLFSTGNDNSFFGKGAGSSNTTGSLNTAIGANANVGSGNLQYATAIGADATVTTSNTITLGRSNGADQIVIPGNLVSPGNLNISANAFVSGSLGVGTVSPQSKLSVQTTGAAFGLTHTNSTTSVATYVDSAEGSFGTRTNNRLGFFTNNSGSQMTLATNGNVGIGTTTPQSKLDVFTAANSFGFSHTDGMTILSSYVGPGSFGTRGGWFGTVTNDPLYFFTNNSAPKLTIFQNGNAALNGNLTVNGAIQMAFITSGSVGVCRDSFNSLGSCSSSLRYKTNIEAYPSGLSVVNMLRPISYEWKKDGMKDVGFGAEEVEKIDQRFVTYNSKGEVEGVKYDRLSVAFVNAFKEQQAQIEKQQTQIELQQRQLDQQQRQIQALIRLACSQAQEAEVCRQPE